MASARFKKLTDLYIKKIRVDLPEGTDIFVRALNSFERDECLDAAQIARSRLVMALKEAGEERLKVEARFEEVGDNAIREELVDVVSDDKTVNLINAIRDDADWKERLEILERTDFENGAHDPTQAEIDLIEKINAEFFEELERRREEEKQLQRTLFGALGAEELREAYLDAWLDKKGRKVANDEYNLTEMVIASEWADGEKLFTSKREAREVPGELYDALTNALRQLAMEPRDPKDLDNDPSSSSSSPTPNAAAGSGSSTSTEVPIPPRGTSRQPSTTR